MKIERTPPITPRLITRAEAEALSESAPPHAPFCWAALVPLIVHPLKVAIIEALLWIEQPLSAKQLELSFDCEEYYLGVISHHAKQLAKVKVIAILGSAPVAGKGVTETFYWWPSDS
jgi:hypothetical protein